MSFLTKLYPEWLRNTKNTPLPEVTFIIRLRDLPIATLTTDRDNNYVFQYTQEFKEQHGQGTKYVRKITGFPHLDKTYKSPYLYPFFLARLPDPNRPIIKEEIEKKGIDKNNLLELIDYFSKRAMNNPYIIEKQIADTGKDKKTQVPQATKGATA